jgi:hypothetical protein
VSEPEEVTMNNLRDFDKKVKTTVGSIVRVQAKYGKTRAITIGVDTPRDDTKTRYVVHDLDPDATEDLAKVFRDLADWQNWAEEDEYLYWHEQEEKSHDY